MFPQTIAIRFQKIWTTPLFQMSMICLCISYVLGMPYLDNRDEFDKIYGQSYMSSSEEDESGRENLAESPFGNLEQPLTSPDIMLDGLYNKYDYDDTVNSLETPDIFIDNKNKRSRSLMPFRYKPQLLIDLQNRRIFQFTNKKEPPQVKRRLQYTAHRGR